MFKAIARLFSAADNAMQVIENVTEAGAIASQSTVKLAKQFDNKQQAILDNMDTKIQEEIAKAKSENRDVNFDDI